MSKPPKLLVTRSVDHELISGGWRRIDCSSATPLEIAQLCNKHVGEILCLRGAWSWSTGDELAYMRRILKGVGVDRAEQRVVERKASEVVFDCGDKMIVPVEAPGKHDKITWTIYAVHQWDASLRPMRRRRRRHVKKVPWMGKLGD